MADAARTERRDPAEADRQAAGAGRTEAAAPAGAVPVRLAALQRLAGNGAVARMLARQAPPRVVQRQGGVTGLDDALRSGDTDNVKKLRPFTGISANQLLSLVNLFLTSAWVGPDDEKALEQAWTSYGAGRQGSLAVSDWEMWKRCEDRGAEIKNVPWLQELRTQFATEVREQARTNLAKNGETINAESKRLGIGGQGDKAAADAAVKDLQAQAEIVKTAKDALKGLGNLQVGWTVPPTPKPPPDPAKTGGGMKPGGLDDELADSQVAWFNIDQPPKHPPREGEHMASWDSVANVHRNLTARVAGILNKNPALYAVIAIEAGDPKKGTGNELGGPGQTPEQARAKIAEALKQISENITSTKASIDDNSLGFEALKPVQEKLYATHPVYSKPFAKAAAKDYVTEAGGDRAAGQLLVTLGTLALIMAVEIGSGGAATPLVGALIGLTASGAQAADSWNQWAKLDAAAHSTVSDAGSVVDPKQADEAKIEAVIDTAMALIDVFGVGKAAGAAKAGARAGKAAAIEAKLATQKRLANLAKEVPAEQARLLTEVIEREGAQAAVAATGKTADELIAIVGRGSAAGERLASLAGSLKPATMQELLNALPQLGTKTAAEAKDLVNRSIDLIGPAQTVRRSGGMAAIEKAVAKEAGVLGRLETWRNGILDQAAKSLPEASGREGANTVRGFLAQLAELPIEGVETALGVAVMFLGAQGEDDDKVKTTAEGSYDWLSVDLDEAALGLARQRGVATTAPVQQLAGTIQRQKRIVSPSDLTERQIDRLTPDEFEEIIRAALRMGQFEGEGLPRMSVLELKTSGSGHGLDGVGFRRRNNLVDLYRLEFKQGMLPELGQTKAGTQGGRNWAEGVMGRFVASDDPVAFESMDVLRARLKRYFGNRYSEDLLFEAFKLQITRAPLVVGVRAHADLSKLLPQLRGLAKAIGKGNIFLVMIRGRR